MSESLEIEDWYYMMVASASESRPRPGRCSRPSRARGLGVSHRRHRARGLGRDRPSHDHAGSTSW